MNLDLYRKDICLIQNLYWNQSACTRIGGYNINNLWYAGDTVLIAESEKELHDLLDKVAEESKKRGLSINCKKTE